MQIAILAARDDAKKQAGLAQLDARSDGPVPELAAPSQPAVPLDVHLRSPTLVEKESYFPTYPWNYELQDTTDFALYFNATAPENWRRVSGSSEWTYPLDMFASLVWYLNALKWPHEPNEENITWLELAFDYQASTHVMLHQHGEEVTTVNAEQQAHLLCYAAKRVAQICGKPAFPDVSNKCVRETFEVNGLTALGLGKAGGLPSRPLLSMPQIVHRILFHAALDAGVSKNAHKRNFIPDFSNLPKALWTPFQRKRIFGKQPPHSVVPEASKRRHVRSHNGCTNRDLG